jgi:hypothetical protein
MHLHPAPSHTIPVRSKLSAWLHVLEHLKLYSSFHENQGTHPVTTTYSWVATLVLNAGPVLIRYCSAKVSPMLTFLLVSWGGWDRVHLVLRPLIGLLYQPRMIDDECGAVCGMRIGRGTEVLGKTLPQCHFFYHKSHVTWPGLESGPPR